MTGEPLGERDLHTLPEGLPVPVGDGAADHLPGAAVPHVRLVSNTGESIDLADAARALLVLYVYPRTGRPGEPSPPGWDAIPGARGCTPQSCAFRDHIADLAAHGAAVMGLSAQTREEQREFATREHIPVSRPRRPRPRAGVADGPPDLRGGRACGSIAA